MRASKLRCARFEPPEVAPQLWLRQLRRDRREGLRGEYVPVARGTGDAGEPLQILVERGKGRRRVELVDELEQRAQPSHADAQLVHELLVASGRQTFRIGANLSQTIG